MGFTLAWGQSTLELEIAEGRLVPLRGGPVSAPIADVAEAVSRALEAPIGFPPLRRALTPDDQIAITVDEGIPGVARLLVPLLVHLAQAGIAAEAITLVCQPPSTGQPWLEDLPEAFQEVHIEVHEPGNRSKLAYLATTRHGRRIYLNRTVVDADQPIVLSRVSWDPLLGVHTGEGDIFPNLADDATRAELSRHLSLKTPGQKPWAVRQEAIEVAGLLGAPFLVQVVPGAGDDIAHVLAGPVESCPAAEKAWRGRWQMEIDQPVDVVLAGISGVATMLDLGRAFQAAARIVKPGGKIVLLSDAAPRLGTASDLMRGQDDPLHAVKALVREKPADLAAGFLWASAAEHAKLYLLSGIPGETVEEMFATPLENAAQAQRFLGPNVSCALLPDAQKALALVRD